MGSFIQLKNFEALLPHANMFKEGLITTVLLAFFTVLLGFVLGLVLSVAIETVQLTAKLGTCDLDDIISNALGAAVGVLLCNLLIPRRPARRH